MGLLGAFIEGRRPGTQTERKATLSLQCLGAAGTQASAANSGAVAPRRSAHDSAYISHEGYAARHNWQDVSSERLAQFEARLAALKSAMESGLADRAASLRSLADAVAAGDEAARSALKTEGHKLRGVAGTYGHLDLTEAAARLEQQALVSLPEVVVRLARELASLADEKAKAKPAAPPVAPRATATLSQAPASSGPRLRVLAIDDDAVTQRLLALTLQQVGGFEATIVSSAQAALALLEEREYDVVVSDAMMPDMNGLEFRRIARSRGLKLPIVMLSAASPDELGWQLKPDQVTDWLRKPFRPTELVRDLLAITARRR